MSTERYDLDTNGGMPIDCTKTKLLYVSMAKYGGDWNSMMHTHASTEIFYVIGGSGQFKIEEYVYTAEIDDLIVVNPNVKHTEVGLTQVPLEYIVLGIEGLEFSAGGEAEECRYCVINFHHERKYILPYLHSMLYEIEHKTAGYHMICQNLLEILLIHLMRRTEFSLTPVPMGSKSFRGCDAVRRYIDQYYKENISLDQLAKLSHFNKYYLIHSFTRQYGTSPINYLINRRIKESRQLLSDTNYLLSEISNILGFSSPSYFSQTFHKLEGMSPMEYRKKCRNNHL